MVERYQRYYKFFVLTITNKFKYSFIKWLKSTNYILGHTNLCALCSKVCRTFSIFKVLYTIFLTFKKVSNILYQQELNLVENYKLFPYVFWGESGEDFFLCFNLCKPIFYMIYCQQCPPNLSLGHTPKNLSLS